mmetsp:Transcript_33754/g.63572  ORF Transcript_33754/g.63572 Transcript_33754/m.63572 type:complete len:257 (-) Transcript_33754:624-1394(-)
MPIKMSMLLSTGADAVTGSASTVCASCSIGAAASDLETTTTSPPVFEASSAVSGVGAGEVLLGGWAGVGQGACVHGDVGVESAAPGSRMSAFADRSELSSLSAVTNTCRPCPTFLWMAVLIVVGPTPTEFGSSIPDRSVGDAQIEPAGPTSTWDWPCVAGTGLAATSVTSDTAATVARGDSDALAAPTAAAATSWASGSLVLDPGASTSTYAASDDNLRKGFCPSERGESARMLSVVTEPASRVTGSTSFPTSADF